MRQSSSKVTSMRLSSRIPKSLDFLDSSMAVVIDGSSRYGIIYTLIKSIMFRDREKVRVSKTRGFYCIAISKEGEIFFNLGEAAVLILK